MENTSSRYLLNVLDDRRGLAQTDLGGVNII